MRLRLLLATVLLTLPAPALACGAFPSGTDIYDGVISLVADASNNVSYGSQQGQATTRAGMLTYNRTANTLMLCDGVSWKTIAVSGSAAAAGSTGQIQFNSGGVLAADAGLNWDNTNKRLGIGTTTPKHMLDVAGVMSTPGVIMNGYFDGTWRPKSTGYLGYIQMEASTGKMWFWNAPTSVAADGASSLSARMVIDKDGNVGVGTTAPGAMLDVAGSAMLSGQTTNTAALEIGQARTGSGYAYVDLHGDTTYSDFGLRLLRDNTGANAVSTIVHRGTGLFLLNAQEAAPLVFSTTNTERVRIDAVGNVGIGVSAPQSKLTVNGNPTYSTSAAATAKVAIRTDSVDTGSALFVEEGTSAQQGLFVYGRSSTRSGDLVRIAALAASGYNLLDLASGEAADGTGAVSRMVVSAAGNVGIGTTSPTSTLDVSGTVRVRNGAISKGGLSTGTTDLGLYSEGGTNWLRLVTNSGQIRFYIDGASGNSYAGGTPSMIVDSNGNVGIGTTSPGYKVDVVGAINTSGGVRITSISTSGSVGVCRDGTAYLTLCSSDIRLKRDIKPLADDAMSVVMKLRPVNFTWKADEGRKLDAGFVAQDVQKLVPEAVGTNPKDGLLTFNINPVVAYTVKALQELKSENDNLRAELHDTINSQDAEIEALRREIQKIKAVNSR